VPAASLLAAVVFLTTVASRAAELLALPARAKEPETPEAALEQPRALPRPCPCCGSRMIIIETFARGCEPKYRPTPPAAIRIDTS
jgi:hypothetical protein